MVGGLGGGGGVCQRHRVNTAGGRRGGRWEREEKRKENTNQVQVFLWSLVGLGGGHAGSTSGGYAVSPSCSHGNKGGKETKCPPLPFGLTHPDVGGDEKLLHLCCNQVGGAGPGRAGPGGAGAGQGGERLASCQSSGIFTDEGQHALPRRPICSEVDAAERRRPVRAAPPPLPCRGSCC